MLHRSTLQVIYILSQEEVEVQLADHTVLFNFSLKLCLNIALFLSQLKAAIDKHKLIYGLVKPESWAPNNYYNTLKIVTLYIDTKNNDNNNNIYNNNNNNNNNNNFNYKTTNYDYANKNDDTNKLNSG